MNSFPWRARARRRLNEVVRAVKSVYAVEMKSKNIQLVDNVLIAETGGSR